MPPSTLRPQPKVHLYKSSSPPPCQSAGAVTERSMPAIDCDPSFRYTGRSNNDNAAAADSAGATERAVSPALIATQEDSNPSGNLDSLLPQMPDDGPACDSAQALHQGKEHLTALLCPITRVSGLC